MPWAGINGIRTYYQTDGDGPHTFALFNGAGCTTRTWDELAPGLVKLGRVLRWDARGAGQTPPSLSPYSLKSLSEDALALMDLLGIQKPIFIAHAFGGRVAQVFTRDHAERVGALILCGTGGLFPPLPLPQPPAGADTAARVETFLATYYGSGFREKHPERAQRIIDDYVASAGANRAGQPGRQLQMEPAPEYWGKVADSIPVLLVYGTEDKFGHEKNARDLAGRLKNSKLVWIEGAGHMAIQEEPEQVLGAISEFIKERKI